MARHRLDLGLPRYAKDLRAEGEVPHIQVLGLATVASDVPVELALKTITSHMPGALSAAPALNAALADRIR